MLKIRVYNFFYSWIDAPSTKPEWDIYRLQKASKMKLKIQIPKISRYQWFYHCSEVANLSSSITNTGLGGITTNGMGSTTIRNIKKA